MPTVSGHISQYQLQAAIYQTLTTDNTLMAMVTGVFDPAPENQPFPYVTFGDHYEGSPHPGFGKLHRTVNFFIDVWSEQYGFSEISTIMERITELLETQTYTLTNFQTVFMQLEKTIKMTDPDGIIRHGQLHYLVFNMAL